MSHEYQSPFKTRFATEQIKALANEIRTKNAQIKKKKGKIIGRISVSSVYNNESTAKQASRCDSFT